MNQSSTTEEFAPAARTPAPLGAGGVALVALAVLAFLAAGVLTLGGFAMVCVDVVQKPAGHGEGMAAAFGFILQGAAWVSLVVATLAGLGLRASGRTKWLLAAGVGLAGVPLLGVAELLLLVVTR